MHKDYGLAYSCVRGDVNADRCHLADSAESIKEALKKGGISLDSFEEIRIRTQRPVSVRRKMNLFI